MLFWIIASLLAVLVAALFALALFRARAQTEHPAEYDLRVYRDQLKEVERDVARGVLNGDDAVRIRSEVSRRVLTADAQLSKAAQSDEQPQGLTSFVAFSSAFLLIGGALALYLQIGSPGQDDLPHKARLAASQTLYAERDTQAAFLARLPARPKPQIDETYSDLITKLRNAVAEKPDEIQGQQFLATSEARLGNFAAAQKAQTAVITLKGDAATASDHLTLAQMLITEAQGYVSPEAEASLRAALAHTPNHPVARYFMGQMWVQNDRPDKTFALWSKLLTEGPESAPWIAPIRQGIDDIAWLAGREYTQPEPVSTAPMLSGPTSEDIENSSEMSEEERQDMIRGMVSRLSDRLATEGGTPDEWSRLIGAYGILGETERAKAIWNEAQMRFADKPEALATVRQGAVRAGVAP